MRFKKSGKPSGSSSSHAESAPSDSPDTDGIIDQNGPLDPTAPLELTGPAPTQPPAKSVKQKTPKKQTRGTWTGKKLVALVSAVAVVSLLAGALVMQFIVSPAELAARTEAPEAGPVTAPVEDRIIENTVTTRGEITYADPVKVTIDTTGSDGRPVVTGQVPEVGKTFETASVALEVTGRPVIVLPGELPSYRSLAIGMSGPDVYQLKQALAALGYWAGDPESDYYSWDTSTAVGELYNRVGYSAPSGGEEAAEALRVAQSNVRAAETGVTRAQAAWNAASAANQPDLSVESSQIEEAQAALSDAYDALENAEIAVQPTLPSGEVLFLASLPRRVDEVFVKRGDILQGPAMTVSGATLTIQGTLSKDQAALITPGLEAFYTAPDGQELTATVKSVDSASTAASTTTTEGAAAGEAEKTSSDRLQLTLDPGTLSDEQVSALRGQNVRVTIPVASTEGSVLAVPVAALSASPDGGNRVELLVPTASDPFATEVVDVSAGLSAGGFVEIKSDDSRIKPGAKVVVGR